MTLPWDRFGGPTEPVAVAPQRFSQPVIRQTIEQKIASARKAMVTAAGTLLLVLSFIASAFLDWMPPSVALVLGIVISVLTTVMTYRVPDNLSAPTTFTRG